MDTRMDADWNGFFFLSAKTRHDRRYPRCHSAHTACLGLPDGRDLMHQGEEDEVAGEFAEGDPEGEGAEVDVEGASNGR